MEIQYDYISVCIIGLWLKRGDDGSNLTVVYINILIFSCNVKNLFFTFCLNEFTLFDSLTSSGKPFKIKGPKYDNYF